MAESSADKAYARILAQRQKALDKNMAQGRTMDMVGTSLNPDPNTRATTLSEVMDKLRDKKMVQNIENTVKSTPDDLIGIDPAVAYKSRFSNLDKKIGGTLEDVASVASKEKSLLNNAKGFGKPAGLLGLAAAGLMASSIANKVQAGEYGEAALDTADVATDLIPGVGQVKFAVNPSELGNAELPQDEMKARAIYNEEVRRSKGDLTPVNNPSTELPLIAPDDRVKYEDMKKFSDLMGRMKK